MIFVHHDGRRDMHVRDMIEERRPHLSDLIPCQQKNTVLIRRQDRTVLPDTGHRSSEEIAGQFAFLQEGGPNTVLERKKALVVILCYKPVVTKRYKTPMNTFINRAMVAAYLVYIITGLEEYQVPVE